MASRIRTHVFISPVSAFSNLLSAVEGPLWQPRVDVYEMEDAFLVQIEAPGMNIDDLELHFEPGRLIVEGVRVRPPLPSQARAALVEMNHGPFRRVVPIPTGAQEDAIKANYENGILSVLVPRKPKTAPRRVPIENV